MIFSGLAQCSTSSSKASHSTSPMTSLDNVPNWGPDTQTHESEDAFHSSHSRYFTNKQLIFNMSAYLHTYKLLMKTTVVFSNHTLSWVYSAEKKKITSVHSGHPCSPNTNWDAHSGRLLLYKKALNNAFLGKEKKMQHCSYTNLWQLCKNKYIQACLL